MPWDFSREPDPGELGFPNRPSPEGRRLGRHLARFAEQEDRKLRLDGIEIPARCHDCALRRGTNPNQCARTLMDVTKALVEGEPFYCHLGDGESLCRGWLILTAASNPGKPKPPILLPPIGGDMG